MNIDELISEGAPVSGDKETVTFTAGSANRTFTASVPRDVDSLSKIYSRAKKLGKLTAKKTPNAEWHPYLPMSENVSRGVAFIEECLVEPKLSTLDALKLSKHAGAYFMEIVGELLNATGLVRATADEEEIDDLGEGFAGMETGAT